MALFPHPLVVVDTETSGFPGQSWCCLLEVGLVLLDTDGREARAWHTLVRPTLPYDPRMEYALRVNRITWARALAAPPAAEVAWALRTWASEFDHEAVAFPTHFDARVLALAGDVGLSWGRCVAKLSGCRGLAEAAARWGVAPREPAHCALADAATTADVAVAVARAGGWV